MIVAIIVLSILSSEGVMRLFSFRTPQMGTVLSVVGAFQSKTLSPICLETVHGKSKYARSDDKIGIGKMRNFIALSHRPLNAFLFCIGFANWRQV